MNPMTIKTETAAITPEARLEKLRKAVDEGAHRTLSGGWLSSTECCVSSPITKMRCWQRSKPISAAALLRRGLQTL